MQPNKVIYEDDHVIEFEDGSTQVQFTHEEWRLMLTDPSFGYVCRNGHRLSDSDRQFMAIEGICPWCMDWDD